MQNSHPPEVLRDLCARLRREPPAAADLAIATWSGTVHEITREELSAAYYGGVLEIDRRATNEFGLTPVDAEGQRAAAGIQRTWMPSVGE